MRPAGVRRTAALTVTLVLVMGGLAWAAVPFYTWFCEVTGFGGTPAVADAGSAEVVDQTITIRFDASLESGMPWDFRPLTREVTLRIGESGLVFYEAYNPTSRPIAGTASYNVFPYDAGGYFTKVQCFCFEQQVLQPGERVKMAVSFFVDPAIVEDRDAKHVRHITLSYTFHETDLPAEALADLETN